MASVSPFKDTIHTFVERKNYKGLFLPGFIPHHIKEAFNRDDNKVNLDFVDHIVTNHGEKEMETTANWY